MSKTAKKVVKGVVIALVALVVVAVVAFWAMFHSELKTLGTIEREGDSALFTMTYCGDYGFDAFLAQGGAASDSEVQDFVIQRLMKGLPFTFELPELGCSTISVSYTTDHWVQVSLPSLRLSWDTLCSVSMTSAAVMAPPDVS